MNQEIKQCQSCNQEFKIDSDDFVFYENLKISPPTRCPECRQRRRYVWRNERTLYRRNCDLCGKSTVTIYSPNKPYKVYCPPCWWSDKWSALDYGIDFDFTRPFFEQFYELQLKVPRIALLTKNSVNSEYTNHSNNNKNCYLSFGVFDSENIMYSTQFLQGSQNCSDCYHIEEGGNLLYECIDSRKCYRCQFGMLLVSCADCFYCYDCRDCSYCFMSSNLRHKKYCILNKQYTKEEYEKKMEEFKLGSYASRVKLYKDYLDLIQKNSIHRFAVIERSDDATGNLIYNCKNTHNSFVVSNMENNKYSVVSSGAKDTMDASYYGFQCEIIYECHALIHAYNVLFSHLCYDDSYIQYCDTCQSSQNLFGCVGINKGEYSIFNKKYSKEDYEILKNKIIEYMKETEEYGEFFPQQLSPFGYNETQGQVHMPLIKEEALRMGYKWEDLVSGTFGKETLKPEKIEDDIKEVKDSILKEVLCCEKCTKNYNIVKAELEFYQHENIPIPRKCPECRYFSRVALRTPRKLWHRKCMKQGCPNEFETAYAPDRPEIVYCESCYQQEVI